MVEFLLKGKSSSQLRELGGEVAKKTVNIDAKAPVPAVVFAFL